MLKRAHLFGLGTAARRFGLALSLLLMATTSPAAAQEPLRPEAPDPSCKCRLELTLDLILQSGDSDTPAIGPNAFVVRTAAGSYVVGPLFNPGELLEFDSEGVAVRSIGRLGQGPGELGRVRFLGTLSSGAVATLDAARLTVFSPSGVVAFAATMPRGTRAFRFAGVGDGHVVLNNYLPGRPAFVLLDSTLSEVGAFGPHTPRESPSDSDAIQYWMASLGSNRFVAVAQNYRRVLEIWDTSGDRIAQHNLESRWFQDWTQAARLAAGPGAPPFPRVEGVYADSQAGQVWITTSVADRRGRNRPTPRRDAIGSRVVPESALSPIEESDARFDTVIEVVDLTTGTIRLSQRFDRFLPRFTSDGRIYAVSEGPDGLLRIEIWTPRLIRLDDPNHPN